MPQTVRSRGFESLEDRRALIAEGATFNLTDTLTLINGAGSPTAVVDWGDGQTSIVTPTDAARGVLHVRFDYSFDTTNFFNTPLKKQILEQAADAVISRLGDTLDSITPSAGNQWSINFFNPSTGGTQSVSNPVIAANELLVYVGARELGGATSGSGGPGGFNAQGSTAFLNAIRTRGETGVGANPPTDVAPWGGAIAFDINTKFHFGETTDGLDGNEVDFYSVVSHELCHLLGFGLSNVFQNFVTSDLRFHGPASMDAYDKGGPVPLSDAHHWDDLLTDNGQEAEMAPTLLNGTRKFLTELDFAALDDIGWDYSKRNITVASSHAYGDNGNFNGSIRLAGANGGMVTTPFSVNVTNVSPTLNVVGNQTVSLGQPLSLIDVGLVEDPGFGNSKAAPPTSESFSYSISWGDGSANSSGTATIDQTGGAGKVTKASFDGLHTYSTVGTYNVQVTVTDDDQASTTKSFSVNVTGIPTLELAINRSDFREDAGTEAATGTVTRKNADTAASLVVNVSSSDTSESTVPATVTIPAGQTSANFSISAVDDTLLDGSQTVNVKASAAGFSEVSKPVTVLDAESLSLEVTRNIVSEQTPTTTRVRISRSNSDRGASLDVTLNSGDVTEITLPNKVTIPAGEASVSFNVQSVADGVADGTQSATIAASVAGYASASTTIHVVDPAFRWQNPLNASDVNGDGIVSPIDALLIINDINDNGARPLTGPDFSGDKVIVYIDTSGDDNVTAIDVLFVINAVNGGTGEGESSAVTIIQPLAHASARNGVEIAYPPESASQRDVVSSAQLLPIATNTRRRWPFGSIES